MLDGFIRPRAFFSLVCVCLGGSLMACEEDGLKASPDSGIGGEIAPMAGSGGGPVAGSGGAPVAGSGGEAGGTGGTGGVPVGGTGGTGGVPVGGTGGTGGVPVAGTGGTGGMIPNELPNDCAGYCQLIVGNCAANSLFPDEASCLQACEAFPTDGQVGAVSGNSLQCRIYHANVAATDAALHCPHAQPHGGGACGSPCEAYCDQITLRCPQSYPNRLACEQTCASMNQVGASDAISGNSVQCRTYHGSFPSAQDGAMHCPHAGLTGGGVCGSACEAYCDQVTRNCPTVYGEVVNCLSACEAMPTTLNSTAQAGNSAECRAYHASFPAQADMALHCPHAAITGAGVCGSNCDGYCDQMMANCPMTYATLQECQGTCEVLDQGGAFDAKAGDSVQCRAYHASFPANGDGMLHCPHAGIDGAGVCAANN